MDNGVPLTEGGFSSWNVATYFHDVEDIGGRLYENGRELELEPGYVIV